MSTKSAKPPTLVRLPRVVDPLTEVLAGTRLRCMIPGAHEMTAPWGLRFGPVSPERIRAHHERLGLDAPPPGPVPVRGAILAVTRGSCCLTVPDHDARLPLAAGDVVLVSRDAPFVLADDWRTPAVDVHELIGREQAETLAGLRHGGGGVPTTFLAGAFLSDDPDESGVLATLPPVICIRGADPASTPWLDGTLRFLQAELTTRAPGSQAVVDHLAHVLFVQAVRAYAASLPDGAAGGWLAAIRDPALAVAIGLIHQRPAEPWTVATLAEQAGAGRSAFAAKFAAAVGRPPLAYLTDCRMRLARDLLRTTTLPAKTVAARVGYSNESAFTQAFKRAVGVAPGAYRAKA